jgi:protein-disulfide isomerase
VVFSDFQCPFCAKFAAETWPKFKAQYVDTGQVRVAYRHLPLVALHPRALRAAEAAECAGRQGKFWEMHDALFNDPSDLSDEGFAAFGKRLLLKSDSFGRCLDGEAAERIRRDTELAAQLGIRATPTFIVGVTRHDETVKALKVLAGALPLENFRRAIEEIRNGR